MRAVLPIVGVAIGVAAVAAIQYANASVTESFREAAAALSGRSDFVVTGVRGVPDATRLAQAGYDAVLVGESLVTAGEPAAAVAAWRLRHDVGARLLGEPCGASVNHVGAVQEVKLPSGRGFWFGSEIHVIDKAHPDDFSSPIVPDVTVAERHADRSKGSDLVMARALDL